MHTLIECLPRGLREQDIGPDGGQDGYAGYEEEEGATFFHAPSLTHWGRGRPHAAQSVLISSNVLPSLTHWGRGRPQGSPPHIHTTPALTMTTDESAPQGRSW